MSNITAFTVGGGYGGEVHPPLLLSLLHLKTFVAWTIKEFPVDLTLSLDLWEEVVSTQREHAKTDLDPASKVSKTAATEQESKRNIVTLKFSFPQCD